MSHLHFPLNNQDKGKTIKATIQGTECNVLLMDTNNYNNYKMGRKFNYYGGHYKQSPVLIPIPHSAIWHVVIDGGKVRATVEVIG